MQGKQLLIEVKETFTVRQTKEKIEEEHKISADSIKLVYSGKVLTDDSKSLKEYAIKEGDFLVVMIAHAKVSAKPKEDTPMSKPVAA